MPEITYRASSSAASDRYDVPSSNLLAGVAESVRKPIDSQAVQDAHARLLSHYLTELDNQAQSRLEMEQDEAIYDHDQWDEEDIRILKERGQEPLTYNVTAQSVNWVLGTERRTRTNYRILPRRKQDGRSAERKSQLLKYLADTNLTEFAVSRAFADATKAGVGWLECGVQEDAEGEPIYEGYAPWRSIIYDTLATELDLGDARFLFRTKWLDTDVLHAMFPDRKGVIESAISRHYEWGPVLDQHGDSAMDAQEALSEMGGRLSNVDATAYSRDRVRTIEAWYRIPMPMKRMAGGTFTGEVFDPHSPGHANDLMTGEAELRERLTYRVHCMVMTLTGPLWHGESPYRHNRYPLTPIWGYRKASDGTPYGLIRGMRGAQKDINKRMSKALAILNSNKVIMDKGAVDDLDEFAEEVGRPDAIIVKNQGKHLEIGVERDLAATHLQIMQMSMSLIQTLSGVTDESMGRTTNATSGRAVMARQEQGQMSTATLFDNLRLARQFHGAKTLSLIEQFMTEEKTFRITNQRGNPEYVTVNDGLPENDIVRTKADFVISEEAWNATLRQAAVEQFMQMLTQLGPVAPNVVMAILDLLVEMMDLPNGEEVVRRVRQITGMEDPDADPDQPDPEREQRQQMQALQQEMQMRAAEAEIATAEAKAAETAAKAQKIGVETARAAEGIASDKVATQDKAMDVAAKILLAAGVTPVADKVLQTAGFQPAPPATPQPMVTP